MFDKVTIKATIDTADIDTVVLRNYLEQCTEEMRSIINLPPTPTLMGVLLRFMVVPYVVNVRFISYIPKVKQVGLTIAVH